MNQFELDLRYRLAMYRWAAYSTVVGLFVLLGSTWLDREVSTPLSAERIQEHNTGLDLYLSEPLALVLYVAVLVLAIAWPPQRWISSVAGWTGLLVIVATLRLATGGSWSPVIGLVITLWLVFLGICWQARRVADR
jgi:hypothetical protein